MATLHLFNKDHSKLPQPNALGGSKWETGYWYVSESRAESMRGAVIHLHRKKSEPSFLAALASLQHRLTSLDTGARIVII